MSANPNFESVDSIVEFYRNQSSDYLRVNMILSLDGNFVGPSNSSKDLANETDLRVLLTLRAMSDVVLVGARTAIGERYRYTQIKPELTGLAVRNPPFCLVSQSLNLPESAPIFADSAHKPFLLTKQSPDPHWQDNLARLSDLAHISIISKSELDGTPIRLTLNRLGFSNILCEGGPNLLATMFRARVVDELDLTISPAITGKQAQQPPLGDMPMNMRLAATNQVNNYLFNRFLPA